MACEMIRQKALDLNLSRSDWQQATMIVRHLDRCEECRKALLDFDEVCAVLKSGTGKAAEPAGGWDAFEARMTGHVADRKIRRWPGWVAAAASLLIGASVGLMWSHRPGTGKAGVPTSVVEKFSASEVAERTAAFGKVAEVFEGKAAWMLLTGADSDLGMTDKSGGSDGKLMLLRLTMTDGSKVVSQADLVMLPGQQADPVLSFVNGQKLRYRITPEAGRVAVWVQVERGDGGKDLVASLGSSLAAVGGQVLPVGQVVTPLGRYELNVAVSYSTL